MMGLNTAFQPEPIAIIIPAIPGDMPATVVRKNRKNVPTKLYEIESASEAIP